MTSPREELRGQRVEAVRAWTAFVERGDEAAAVVRPEILRSWERSGVAISPDVAEAPMADESDTAAFWQESPLQVAVSRIEDDLRRTAEDGDLVVAVTDADTRILWTYGGRVMRRKAESVNFVPGGRWGETSIGTNALALATTDDRPSMVFSAEHFAPIVHNWVCWAAPVHDPVTGEQLGVIDLSTTWDRTHPIGMATARVMARLLENALPQATDRSGGRHPGGRTFRAGLQLTLLGRVDVVLDGQRLLLTRRQSEILALLALHPAGLTLEHLQALVYGDKAVSPSTLKAEVSHLRSALGGQLASRPYRLMMPVDTDVETVLDLLRRGHVAGALEAYGGDLFPGTSSPALTELAEVVAVSVREALLDDPQPGAVMRYTELAPYDTEVIEVALAALPDARHPARALLKGRLAAAGRA